MDIINNVTGWNFLQEPLWRWFLFFGALLGIGWAWHGILEFMK